VGYLLDSLGVVLDKNDEVRPPVPVPLDSGDVVRVVRVRHAKVSGTRRIPFQTRTRYTDQLIRGQRRVQREGRPGLVQVEFRVRKEDGKVVDRKVLSRRQTRAPVTRVLLVGTRNPNTQTGTSSWYYRDGMVAAHKTLPKGTRVRVTNLANGKQVTVVIDDRGPFVNGWIIDLSDDAFAKLAPLGTGTIKVRLEW
jgi:rare lipoprotein A (peptidoglycan hydrolase)